MSITVTLGETLAFNRLSSVKEEEEAEVVGAYQIRFLLFFFCFSFVFLLCVSFVLFLSLPLIIARALFYYVEMLAPHSLDIFCCDWPSLLSEA